MRLNKNTAYVLLYLLSGNRTAAQISRKMNRVDIRSIQRALTRLSESEITSRSGPHNNPSYSITYSKLFNTNIPTGLFDNEDRPETVFNHEMADWLHDMSTAELDRLFEVKPLVEDQQRLSIKELEYLTIELSWKSSSLEGNSYTLLDTELLLTEGVRAKNRTEFETQMILNHKNAIGFIIENPQLFNGKIPFAAVEKIHTIIGNNLGIDPSIRKKTVRISASNYTPLSNPHQLRENSDKFLEAINRVSSPYIKSLLALGLIPYLQIFEDGNKRTGRMLANAILISMLGKGFSLRKVSPKELAIAYLSFYEFNSFAALNKILTAELSMPLKPST